MSVSREERRMYWISIMEDWKESGLSGSKYCMEHKLSTKTFSRWKKELSNLPSKSSSFTELKVKNELSNSGLWFEFGNGAKLVIDNEFNALTFKKLMGVLSGC